MSPPNRFVKHRTFTPPPPRIFIYAPLCVVAAMVLWKWCIHLSDYNWWGDVDHYMYYGQRLAAGYLPWTGSEGYSDRLLAGQLPFLLAGALGNIRVWQLTGMGFALLGAWGLWFLCRDMFSARRGFPAGMGHCIGLYGGVFMLYLHSAGRDSMNFFNPMAMGMVMAALALCRLSVTLRHSRDYRHSRASGNPVNNVDEVRTFWIPACAGMTVRRLVTVWQMPFIVGCLLASLAVGVRPYLLLFAAIIPLWAALGVQAESESRGGRWRSTLKLFLQWNLLCFAFGALVNIAPYILAGELDALRAGLFIMSQKLHPKGGFLIIHFERQWAGAVWLYQSLAIAAFLYLAGLLWACYAAAKGKAAAKAGAAAQEKAAAKAQAWPRQGWFAGPALLDICFLAALAPLAIYGMLSFKHFLWHYIQFYEPFVAAAAAAGLVALAHFVWALLGRLPGKGRRYQTAAGLPGRLPRNGWRWQQTAAGCLLLGALVWAAPRLAIAPLPSSIGGFAATAGRLLQTRSETEGRPWQTGPMHALRELLARHQLPASDFLAPRNMYVHWMLRQPRHGFPHAEHTVHIANGWWRGLAPPPSPLNYPLPRTRADYCEALNRQGPKLLIFFRPSPLTTCPLPNYAYHEETIAAPSGAQTVRYFLR